VGRIDRYLLAQLLGAFGMAALLLVGVLWIDQAVQVFDQLIADGQSPRVFLELTALGLPPVVKEVLPAAAVAATLQALVRLSADSELTVVRAMGASPWRIARPVLLFGLLVGALVAVLGHVLVPQSLRELAERQAEIAETATARLLRPGEFVSPVDGVTLYLRAATGQGAFEGLLLSDRRDPAQEVTITAASATLVRDAAAPRLVLVDGLVQRLGADGRLAATTFGELVYELGALLPAGDGTRSSRELSTRELLRPSPALAEETGKSVERLLSEAHERLAEALSPVMGAMIGVGALLLGGFSRFGVWRQVLLAVGLVIGVKALESVAVSASRADPALWFLPYAPGLLGIGTGALLLTLSAQPWRRGVPA
jgi:lipopolysaccharide export system permease protein